MPNEIQPYDPEESNRQTRDAVRETVRAVHDAVDAAQQGGRWLLYAQLAVAVATIILVVFNGLTVYLTHRQVKAVWSSIEQSQYQFSLSERPWVGTVDLEITDIELGKQPLGLAKITNAGRSPALATIALTISSQPTLPKSDSRVRAPSSGASTAIILPGATISSSVTAEQKVVEKQLELLRDGKLFLYVWGRISYAGTSGGEYETLFCGYFHASKKKLIACPDFNQAT